MGKWILLALVSAFGAWWFFHAGRQMSEDAIEAQYDLDSRALVKFDADYFCDRMADDYRHEAVTFGLNGTQRQTLDKHSSCEEMREGFRAFKRLNALTNGAIQLSFQNRIVEITLSDDRKTADVESISTVRMGRRLLSRSHSMDRVIRRNGRILHEATQSKSWVYVPAK